MFKLPVLKTDIIGKTFLGHILGIFLHVFKFSEHEIQF